MGQRKKNPAIKSSGTTSSKASPLPDWVKGGAPKPPPSYTKAGKEYLHKKEQDAAAAATAAKQNGDSHATSSSASTTGAQTVSAQREMLFPPGSKTPLNMLYERVQKLAGWEKPVVEPRRHKDGYSAIVILKKVNKKDGSNPFIVSMEPKEPGLRLECPSSLEAKHWAATYALFRMFNVLSLHLALPPGPREYWLQLEAYKKQAPAHQDWMWESDPFEAQAKRDAEKAKKEKERLEAAEAAERGEVGIANGALNAAGKPLSKAWQQAREVRLASTLREKIEATIRKAMSIFPDACKAPLNLDEEGKSSHASSSSTGSTSVNKVNEPVLEKELSSLGFRPGHARSAVRWLISARQALSDAASPKAGPRIDPMLASAASLADREAALEYLMLYTPEEDLPVRFKPSLSSEKFITASKAGSGGDALAVGWAVDRISRQAGYPRLSVERCFRRILAAEASFGAVFSRQIREGLALEMLTRQLSGWDQIDEQGWSSADVLNFAMLSTSGDEARSSAAKRDEERMAVEAVLGADRIALVPEHDRALPSDYDVLIAGPATSLGGKEDVRLRVTARPDAAYPQSAEAASLVALPTFFVASTTLPSYLQLALVQHILRCFIGESCRPDWREMLDAGEGGVILAIVEELESCWASIVDSPPLLSDVMQHLVGSSSHASVNTEATPNASRSSTPSASNLKRTHRAPRQLQKDAALDSRLIQQQQALHASKSYASMGAIRRSLPAFAAAGDILDMIRSNRVVIIAGETGCGKTTQIPQFILDEAIAQGHGSECNIVVTQPRRVSAIGVASRVATERGENLDTKNRPVAQGSLVGYAIRGERRATKDCRLLFTTTGVLLRRLGPGGDKDLNGISHVIVDEVHERNVDSDFLLLELRELIRRNPKIRVVLMSATINQETFSAYFGGAPCMSIPGRTFPVEDYYLEDFVRESGFRPSGNEFRSGAQRGGKQIEDQIVQLRSALQASNLDDDSVRAIESLSRSGGRISYELVGAAVSYVVERAQEQEALGLTDSTIGGAILVFLPGVGEIRQAMDAIALSLRGDKVDIMPLHANLSPDEQRKVFLPVKAGRRKIVVSTNVAETSITIPDVSYVVDSGRVKETRFEPENGLTRLVECWASRAACRQRRGRAGRVRAGECFRLYTRLVEEKHMSPQQTPEMRRVPLESLFLEVKSMRDNEDVQMYLNKALDPPSVASMDAALRNLIEAGAINSDDGFKSRLTPLGRHLAQLPLDLRLAKLLIMATIFGCLGPMLTVASIMSCKPLFSAPFEKREQLSQARSQFASNMRSDLLADATAFHEWQMMRARHCSNADVRQFCDSNFLSMSTLRDIQTTRTDLLSHLQEMGFAPVSYSAFGEYDHPQLDANASHIGLLRAIILAGLWPSIIRIDIPSAKFDQSSSGTVQREAEARQVKYFDRQGRVFLHPSSTLFSYSKGYQSSYLASFSKSSSGAGIDSKVYLRDATEVPLFGLLLFGGRIKINHLAGGISIGSNMVNADSDDDSKTGPWVRLRANARIGVLCAQLRRLLDAVLENAIDSPQDMHSTGDPATVELIHVIGQVLERDGMD